MQIKNIFWTKTKNVNRTPYFIGMQFRKVATILNTLQNIYQIRIGLIWIHIGITYIL